MFKNIEEIKKANDVGGYHWFDEAAMRGFGTEIESQVFEGKYFITSELPPWFDGKVFTIRVAHIDTGQVETFGEKFVYLTKAEALEALEKIILKEVSQCS